MSDKFVTVATFNKSFEAQLAKNLLENEGIDSHVGGDFSSDVLFGSTTVEDQIVLQVAEEDAQRAAGILAAVAAAKLDDNWEEQAEAGVWLCTICGEPISNRLSVCHSCQTPREGIRAGSPRDRTAIQPEPTTLPRNEEIQKPEEIARAAASLSVAPAPPIPASMPDEEREEELPTAAGDALARRAFLASMIGVLMPCLLPVGWYYLLRVVVFSGELSAKGVRHQYAAMLINGFLLFFLLVMCTWRG